MHRFHYRIFQAIAVFLLTATVANAQVRVVNMIPQSRSGEANQDSEPNIAVNPANPLHMAASAFTPDPTDGPYAPIYKSIDGGKTWNLNSILPGAGPFGTGDITLRFGGTSNILYAGILRGDSFLRLNILRTPDFTSPAPMTILVDRDNVDQPYIQAATVPSGSGKGDDRVYIGLNDFAAVPKTATVDRSLSAATAPPPAGFSSIRLEGRSTEGQDGPQNRPTIHSDGTVYVAFYGWRKNTGSGSYLADVVVCRDDNWGSGATPFTSLKDPGDGLAGMRVLQNINLTFNNAPVFGQERVGGNLSIAVDPTKSATVYLCYSDFVGNTPTLHVRRSLDKGATWSDDLRTIAGALNPSLAINDAGRVGFLYQQLSAGNWVTHFELTSDGFATLTDLVLANTPSAAPQVTFLPYLGDYTHAMAVGRNFYGVFSANNTPDLANFPNGVVYQRNANFTSKKLFALDNTTEVDISIDPFFFAVEDKGPRYAYVGCRGDHHLTGETGTALYTWHHQRWLVNLVDFGSDKNYWYYYEREHPKHKWAFGKHPDQCGHFPVWFLPGNESNGEWVFYQHAQRVTPATRAR